MTTTSSELYIDIETYSETDIRLAGLYPYVEDPSFEVLLIAWAWNDEPVKLLDLAGGDYDPWEAKKLSWYLTDPAVLKIAHNNPFERTALGKWLDTYLPPDEWDDTMIRAAYNGLPMSLDEAGAALNIERKKLKSGTALINYFCKPCAPTKSNGGRTRNRPDHAPDKWQTFKEYCARDVDAMRQIRKRLKGLPVMPAWEREVWCMDARINERGVLVDRQLAEAAVAMDGKFRAECEKELATLTGLENPNSVAQLKAWLNRVGTDVESLNKATVTELRQSGLGQHIDRALELRQLLGKTSVKKYQAMLDSVCEDGRIRGITQYYGTRTGRWAGRKVQLQNLPQNHLADIADVREIVRAGDLEGLELLYDSVPDTLSQLIRTAFIAKPGYTFLVADYSAIEARVIAYLASEEWRQEVFAKGGDIYCASASRMFKVPVEKHGVNSHLRQKGKIAELALGYGGGINALKAFGADKMGLADSEMEEIVSSWREASPRICKFWRNVEQAAKIALKDPGREVKLNKGTIRFQRDGDALRCTLPSGRTLTYWGAGFDEDGNIVFMGQNQVTRKWERIGTWGGKLVENIVQAFARDCLATAMLRLDKAGYQIVFHVHDEIICEMPEGSRWEEMAEIMGQPIDWAPGLLLRAEGYSTPFYLKD